MSVTKKRNKSMQREYEYVRTSFHNRRGNKGTGKQIQPICLYRSDPLYVHIQRIIVSVWNRVCYCILQCYPKLYDITLHEVILYYMIWHHMIWYDMMWYGMIWYDMILYDMIWCHMILYDMTSDYIIW